MSTEGPKACISNNKSTLKTIQKLQYKSSLNVYDDHCFCFHDRENVMKQVTMKLFLPLYAGLSNWNGPRFISVKGLLARRYVPRTKFDENFYAITTTA